MTKQHFTDWYQWAFSYGYGTGEQYIIPAMKEFFAAFEDERSYKHESLESAVGGAVAWLFISRLCDYDVDFIDYGTSPRNGWLTEKGQLLKQFVDSHSNDELYEMATEEPICEKNTHNCDNQKVEWTGNDVCNNPLFAKR